MVLDSGGLFLGGLIFSGSPVLIVQAVREVVGGVPEVHDLIHGDRIETLSYRHSSPCPMSTLADALRETGLKDLHVFDNKRHFRGIQQSIVDVDSGDS